MPEKVILFCGLLCLFESTVLSFAQTCRTENDKAFMKGSRITAQDLQTCSRVDYVMTSLASFLETCQFASSADAPTFAHCSSRCKLQDDCFALTYSTTNGCELCMNTAGATGNGNTYDVSKIMVNLLALRNHINGGFFAVSCQ